jgi:L,D-transpeptidase-like protein
VSKHRAGPQHRHRGQPVNRHRAAARPRYGRIATLVSSLAVTVAAVLGGAGLLPSSGDQTDAAAAIDRTSGDAGEQPDRSPGVLTEQENVRGSSRSARRDGGNDGRDAPGTPTTATETDDTTLPVDSGEGRRIVFSESRQRVWLVDESSQVVRTYLVSGSVYDNLDPGTYAVYSRSEDAVGIEDSGTMKYFVRFTTGDEGAAIGFHDIPIDEGQPVQTLAELGTPQSHGCIRQERHDAIALWEFAPVGTTVVVTA